MTRARLLHIAQTARLAIQHGGFQKLMRDIVKRFHSDELSYEFRYDLRSGAPVPQSHSSLFTRPFEPGDQESLFSARDTKITDDMAGEILNRRLLLDANIPTPYVLVTSDGVPCFIHWLIGPESNEKVKKYFKGFLPLLAPNEVMIEGAFMAPDYRGKGVMTTAVLGIVQKARELDARWVIAYVNPSRIASIRGVQKAGFRPWGEQRVKWRFFGTRFLNRRLSSAEIELLLKQWKQQTKPGV